MFRFFLFWHMKNKKALILGLSSGIISIAALPLLFQSIMALILGIDFNLNGGTFEITGKASIILSAIVYAASPVSLFIEIELCAFLLRKVPPGNFRYSLIMIILIIVGYLIISIFYGAFSVLLQASPDNLWVKLVTVLEIHETGRMVFMFFILLIFTGYLGSLGRIIKEYVQTK